MFHRPYSLAGETVYGLWLPHMEITGNGSGGNLSISFTLPVEVLRAGYGLRFASYYYTASTSTPVAPYWVLADEARLGSDKTWCQPGQSGAVGEAGTLQQTAMPYYWFPPPGALVGLTGQMTVLSLVVDNISGTTYEFGSQALLIVNPVMGLL